MSADQNPAVADKVSVRELESRLKALEAQIAPREPKSEEPTVSLAQCNQRAREVDAELRSEKHSALNVATDALKAAFAPTERARKAIAKTRKPLTLPPTVGKN